MINLHAIYYRNIGPFENQECSLHFNQGKFLIKAPIGSGKSFLFFDGPTYALYRTAPRNMLNIQSQTGEISLIFSADEQYYLVKRILKAGKTKDSCNSQLFTITPIQQGTIETVFPNNNILQRNINTIDTIITNPALHVEEIHFKNETDLQQSLDQLLPPKPVFLSTMFLLQDAENIFEMQPADRLTVLKNVFGLLGIDEAKEQVQDKKRELSYKLKALQDQSQQDAKLRKRLKELHDNYRFLASHKLEGIKTFFEDIEGFLDQITINEFTLNGLDIQLFLSLQQELQAQQQELLTLQTTKNHLTKQINEQTEQITKRATEKKKLTSDLASLETTIANIDTQKIETLKQEKAKLYEQQNTLNTPSILSNNTLLREKFPAIITETTGYSLDDLYTLIQTLKERGKDLANQIQLAEQQLKTQELEAKNQQMKVDQLEQAKKRLANFETNIDEQASFSCEKIGTNCPFIKVINKQHFDQLEKQKETLQTEITQLEKQYAEHSKETPFGTSGTQNPAPTPNIEQLQAQITTIKTFLTDINYKSREEKYAQKEALQKQIHTLDQTIMQLETETQKLQDYQQQKTAFQTSLQNLDQQTIEAEIKKKKLTSDLAQLDQHITNQHPEQLESQLKTLTNILQTIHDIEQLITDATATKNLVKDLQQQEKLLSNLYTILSKEILLIALQEYLPILSEIINSFLIQVVGYQISMKITETTEKLELEAKIYDEKGEREVKSLSGGQRTILKLVRMLAISSYLQTPLLFLDETINNLDLDTIGRVSEMITNFVKQRTMKFFTVTHNTEIQEMDIRDKVIEIVEKNYSTL